MREVFVIGENSEQLGVMTPEEGLIKAKEAGLDLVEVAANSRPPVCRIMDYGRYKYEQKKKKTSRTKNSHAATLKEIKLRPGTDMHDLTFKLNNVRKFLMEGDKVKVTVMFRGREMVHLGRGREQLMQVKEMLGELAKMENPPRMEGRFMSMILVAEREAVAEARRVEEAETQANEEPEESHEETKAERRARKQAQVEAAQQHAESESENAEEAVDATSEAGEPS